MRLVAFLLSFTVGSAFAQPCAPGASAAVSESRTGVAGGQSASAIGGSGDRVFAVWRQTHVGFGGVTYFVNGGVLDADGDSLTVPERQPGWQNNRIAGNGRNFVLVTSQRGYTSASILDLDGKLTKTVEITTGDGEAGAPGVVWNGSHYVVLTTSNDAVIVATVSEAGELVERTKIADVARSVALSSAGDGRVLAVWRISDAVYATIVDGTTPVGISRYITNIAPGAPLAVASDGNGFLVAWREATVVQGLRLTADGTPPSGPPTPLGVASESSLLEVLWEDEQYLVLWSDPMTVVARVDLGGTVTERFVATESEFSSAAATGSGTIILSRTRCGSIVSSLLSVGARGVTSSRDVSLVPLSVGTPEIAESGSGHQLVWRESVFSQVSCGGAEPSLVTRFIGQRGGAAIERLSTPGSSVGGHAIERVGSSTLVVWDEYEGGQTPGVIRVARFDSQGVRQSTEVLARGRFFFDLRVTISGSRLLVAWLQEREDIIVFDVYVALLSETGAVVEGPTVLSRGDDSALWLVAASDGNRSMVSWLNHATTIVTVETDASLQQTRRTAMPLPAETRTFLGAGIRDAAAVILAPMYGDGGSELLAIDPFNATVARLPRGSGIISLLEIVPVAEGWSVLFAEGEETSTIERVSLTTRFDNPTLLACASAHPYAIRYSSGLLAFSARNQVHVQGIGQGRRRGFAR